MVSLTIFDSIYDNKTVKRVDYDSFDDFEKVLYRLANSDKYKKKADAQVSEFLGLSVLAVPKR